MTPTEFNMNTAQAISQGITPGKIKTSDGFDVTIIRWDIDSSFPIGGIVHLGDHNDYLRQWTTEGKGDWRRNVTTNYDLVLEVEGGEA